MKVIGWTVLCGSALLMGCEPSYTPKELADKARAACQQTYGTDNQQESECELRGYERILAAQQQQQQKSVDDQVPVNP